MRTYALLWSDLNQVAPGDSYFCLSRFRPYAHACVIAALKKGARHTYSLFDLEEESHTQWPQRREEQQALIDAFYGPIAQEIKIIAVTGTNGKSSTVSLLQRAIEQAGYGVTLIGTIGVRDYASQKAQSTVLTTPDYADLRAYIHRAIHNKHEFVVMEASSHALSQYRLGTLPIYAAGATAITCDDHIEYHGSPYAYIRAKSMLMTVYHPRFMVLPSPHHLWSYAQSPIYGYIPLAEPPSGSPLNVYWQWPNIQLAQHMLKAIGLPSPADLSQWVEQSYITGRFEATPWANHRTAWVDFAHTPHALEHLFKPWVAGVSHPLWVVIGCGGRRDRAKRPKMLEIILRYADYVIITADNPRDEPFEQIAQDMLQNQHHDHVLVIEDRKKAIAYAAKYAPEHSHIFILGKGHESTQVIGTRCFEYSDRQEVRLYAYAPLLPA